MDIRDLDASVSSHLTFLVGAKIIGNVLFAKSALLSFLLDALYPTTPMCFIELRYRYQTLYTSTLLRAPASPQTAPHQNIWLAA